MNISKRILALAGAGALALALGASMGGFGHTTSTFAGAPTNGAIGCAAGSTSATAGSIGFPAAGGVANPLITGAQLPTNNGTTNGSGQGFVNIVTGSSQLGVPQPGFGGAIATCGVVLEDFGPCGGAAGTGDCDVNINTPAGGIAGAAGTTAAPSVLTVDGGNINTTVTGAAVILQSNAQTWTFGCGSAAPADTAATFNESCQGGVINGAFPAAVAPAAPTVVVSPTPANTWQVSVAQGTSFGAIGGAVPAVTVSATYSRFAAIAATQATFSIGTTNVVVLQPSYALAITVSNGTIVAALPSASTPQVANTTSVVTTSLFRATTNPCIVIGGLTGFTCGVGAIPGGVLGLPTTAGVNTFYYNPGGEPGIMTYQTSLGIWVGSSQSGGVLSTNSYAQTISVQCGSQPGFNPFIGQPSLGQPFQLGLTSCISTTATLAGGGQAGTATIIVSYIGDYTGATTQNNTEINLVPGPSTVNLSTGCNEVITPPSTTPGSNAAAILKFVGGFNVTSIWMFNNATHTFQAFYFSAAGAPTDISAVGPGQSIFICGTGAGTFQVSP